MKNLRGAKISVENLRGMKNSHHLPKNTPTGYPDLKKTGPLVASMREKDDPQNKSNIKLTFRNHFRN